jgi:hypothetical protein
VANLLASGAVAVAETDLHMGECCFLRPVTVLLRLLRMRRMNCGVGLGGCFAT